MYSPRRRYKRYISKKYYRNNLFAPSLKKAPAPNYYQMKGRILQQTPRILKEPPTELMTRSKLDKMYDTLKQYKYNFPLPFDPSLFVFYSVSNQITLDSLGESIDFDIDYFQLVVNSIPKPAAPDGYHYNFDVINMLFYKDQNVRTDTSHFDFNWQSSLLTPGQVSLITKQVDSTITNDLYSTLQCVPYSTNKCLVTRFAFTASGINVTFSRQSTVDTQINDDGYYSFVTSDPQSETYGSKISYVRRVNSDLLNEYKIQFKILIYLSAD